MVNQSWIKKVAKKNYDAGARDAALSVECEILRYKIAADTAAATATGDRNSPSLHSVECLLE